ncbi:hypothetical protein G4V62_01845 [Bacillaceae bacterium SIJ1]|uniref:DUF6123 family protein n=1 Tax=Litoribacterium kuwaitense TaxID=1398745 RepID=UPI0013EC4CAB|nr:DUF6123 family protein [Litoribacterium kuwaitense]NGP43765.1 hypothetical protein [Litoribacterium kuwaitense]
MQQKNLGYYLDEMQGKGFKLSYSDILFIHFAQKFTNANDKLMIIALQVVWSTQFEFDPSFYLSFVERLQENDVKTKKEAIQMAKNLGLYDRLLK